MYKDSIAVQTEDFDIAELTAQIRVNDASNGAIVTFTGIVREMLVGRGWRRCT